MRRPLKPRAGTGTLGGPLVHRSETGSTNDDARGLAFAGAPHGSVVIAEHQTAGRGRVGRTWTAPPGCGLTFSVLVRMPSSRMELLPFAAALAVCEACEETAPVSCAIKWPNDVWIEGRKAAGILIESRPQDDWAVIGIGLNVDTAMDELAPELRETATSLRIATGGEVDRDAVLDVLCEQLSAWTEALHRPERVLTAFRERDALYGRRIAWTSGGNRTSGEARGIEADGALVVFTDDGQRLRVDAEVHLER